MYLPTPREQVSQGDLLADMPFALVPQRNVQQRNIIRTTAVILSHDCDYDKNYALALAAIVRPLSDAQGNSQDNIRKRKTLNTFYLSAITGRLPESFIDFRHIEPIDKAVIHELVTANGRIASLDDEARDSLQRQIAIFFTRNANRDVQLPPEPELPSAHDAERNRPAPSHRPRRWWQFWRRV